MNKVDKREWYEILWDWYEEALERGCYFEAVWFLYSILDDRAKSALRHGGSKPRKVMMLGTKLEKLKSLVKTHAEYRGAFYDPDLFNKINDWIKKRNALMHHLADMPMKQSDLKKEIYLLALNGKEPVKTFSSAVMRLKKRQKA